MPSDLIGILCASSRPRRMQQQPFEMMKTWKASAALLIGFFLLCACTDMPASRFTVDTRSSLDNRDATNSARKEIDRRGLPLPTNWRALVRDSFVDYEFRPSRAIFAVTFYVVVKGKRKDLYEVNIDKQSGKIEDFLDVRKAVPIQVH